MRKIFYIILAGVMALWLGACAHEPENPTARYFVDKGMADFDDASYRDAIESFEKLRDWYPFSQYTILADLKIADAYFELEEYDQAADAYADFERLHPRNEAIPFVIYRIGLCNYDHLDTIDRDQAPARSAIETFNRLINRFPDDEHAIEAAKLIEKCRKSLAGHELYVGRFYYKSKHFDAARRRFEGLISDYPEADNVVLARQYIFLCDQMAAAQAKKKVPTGFFGRSWAKLKEPFTLPPDPDPDTPQVMIVTPAETSPETISPDAVTPDAVSPDSESPGSKSTDAAAPAPEAPDSAIPDEISSDPEPLAPLESALQEAADLDPEAPAPEAPESAPELQASPETSEAVSEETPGEMSNDMTEPPASADAAHETIVPAEIDNDTLDQTKETADETSTETSATVGEPAKDATPSDETTADAITDKE